MKTIEIVTELMDPASAFEINWDPYSDAGESTATAYDRQGREIIISFLGQSGKYPDSGQKWTAVDVEFIREGRREVTGYGDAERVFATVIRAVRTYVSQHAPTYILFSGAGSSRFNLYQAIVNRFAHRYGYASTTLANLPAPLNDLSQYGSEVIALQRTAK
jgi:hypothetical protein